MMKTTEATRRRTVRQPALVRRVAETALGLHLIEPGDRILVSVSGGPDSVALLAILHRVADRHRLSLEVAHFNYGLRGQESDEDERFVAELCGRLGVLCHRKRLDLARMDRQGRSLQALAREQRYAALLQLAEQQHANKVALGHTLDDQAETVLMWVLRGAGTSGLGGMPVRRGPFIRPLLAVRRAEILTFLLECHQRYRIDSSNATRLYLRNRIRHEVLPILEAVRPGVSRVLARQAALLREDRQCLEEWATRELSRLAWPVGREHQLDRDVLLRLPVAIQRRILRRLITDVAALAAPPSSGVVSAVLDRVVHGRSGTTLTVQGMTVARQYGRVCFRPGVPGQRPDHAMTVTVPSTVQWPPTGQRITFRLVDSFAQGRSEALPDATPQTAVLDADRFTQDLILRNRKTGDAFHPLGMSGKRKKLQDYFVDRKVPRQAREAVPILAAPEGILWVAGHRQDHRFRVTTATRRALVAQLVADSRKAD